MNRRVLLGKKWVVSRLGNGLRAILVGSVLAAACCLVVILSGLSLVVTGEAAMDVSFLVLTLLCGIAFTLVACAADRGADASFAKAQSLRLVADADTLPARNSLVRASAEPPPAAHTLLLRATAPGTHTPPEQLVRSVE